MSQYFIATNEIELETLMVRSADFKEKKNQARTCEKSSINNTNGPLLSKIRDALNNLDSRYWSMLISYLKHRHNTDINSLRHYSEALHYSLEDLFGHAFTEEFENEIFSNLNEPDHIQQNHPAHYTENIVVVGK